MGPLLVGAGSLRIVVNCLDWISRWETAMSLQSSLGYLGFLLNPWVGLATILLGLFVINLNAKHELHEVLRRQTRRVVDVSGREFIPSHRRKAIQMGAIALG